MLDYLKHFNRFNSSFLRIKFLRKCLDNDIIPDFVRFRVPDNGVFSNQAVYSFQLRLLRSEISQVNADREKPTNFVVALKKNQPLPKNTMATSKNILMKMIA